MVFDFDGTLIESGRDIAASVNYTLETLGLSPRDSAVIMNFIGDGVQKLIERSLGADSMSRFHEAMEIFSLHYEEHLLDSTQLYDSAIEVLLHFQNKKKIVITNKREHFTLKIVKYFGLMEHFDEIIGADSRPYKKPDPRLLKPLFERYQISPDRTVVIDDGVNDILLARNAGALSCALLNGLTKREALLPLNPDFCCEEISELAKLFI
jgi:phosphoglycolate phosphatase